VNTVTNRVVRLLGKDETVRCMNLSLYQGAPAKKGITTVAMAASANPILADKAVRDPTLFCTGLKRQRFYMFTRSGPEYVHIRHCLFFSVSALILTLPAGL
jgi:peptidylprolyl isomerase domain and WD repeat-containing protein 1